MSETVRLDDETISREQKLRIWQSKSKAPAASFWDSLVELLEHLGPDGGARMKMLLPAGRPVTFS